MDKGLQIYFRRVFKEENDYKLFPKILSEAGEREVEGGLMYQINFDGSGRLI